MKSYFKYTGDWFGNGKECTVLYEITDNYASRQLMSLDNKLVGSNRRDELLEYFLAEGTINLDDFTDVDFEAIQEQDFEEVWGKHCECYKDEWEKSKSRFQVGLQVMGEIEILYPQGLIIKIDENTIAIADYDDCLNRSSVTALYPHQYVSGKVKGYDEMNMWLILEETRVCS